MRRELRHRLLRYGWAALGGVGAVALQRLLLGLIGPDFPFAMLFTAVLVSAALAGRGAALITAAVGAAGAAAWLLPAANQGGSWDHEDWAGLARYCIGSAGMALLVGALQEARGRAEQSAATARAQEESLRLQAEKLARHDRAKDEFLAMLGHELRNPLAPITLANELLKAQVAGNPTAERLRGIIDRNTRDLSRIVDDLLEISRINEGKIELRLEPVNLGEAVEQAAASARPLMDARGHTFTLDLPPEPVTLEADPTRLVQVLVNLLNNAARYTDPGGRISLTAGRDGSEAWIRIRDNGRGIPPELLPRVFDLFVQGEQGLARTEGGLGIGLTLVHRLVRMHGGTVDAESGGPGAGSTFTVRLPLGEPAAVAPPLSASPPRTGRRLRVLIVEDNRDAAETLEEILEALGHETAAASNGRAALEVAPEFHPDLVLLDLGLPGLDGYAVARALRENEGASRALIAAVTGYSSSDHQQRAQEAGFDQFVTKPVGAETLQSLLDLAGAR